MSENQSQSAVTSDEPGFLAPGQQEDGTIAERPSHVPEQFWDAEKGEVRVEDLAKAYAEASKSKTTEGEETADPEAGSEDPKGEDETKDGEADEEKTETEEVQDFLESAGLSMETLGETFEKDGALSADDYAKLAERGITREFADQVARGQLALRDAAVRQLHDAAGGEEQMNTFFQWAGANLPKEKVEELNAAFESQDINSAVVAMGTLKGLYEDAHGKPPARQLKGGNAPAVTGYGSWAEVQKDMGKPEYREDPAFRAKVERKLAASRI